MGLLVLFAGLALAVQLGATAQPDRAVSLAVHGLEAPWLDGVMRGLTLVGSFPFLLPLALVVAYLRHRRGDGRGSLWIVATLLSSEGLNLALKLGFRRTRPSLFHEIAELHSYSFPSGHSMTSCAVYGAIALALARWSPRHARLALGAAGVLVFGVGLSRIYLGVHWPTDVLAGWTAGALVALGSVRLAEQAQEEGPLYPPGT